MHYGVISQESNSVNISHLKISFYLKKKAFLRMRGKIRLILVKTTKRINFFDTHLNVSLAKLIK